MSRPATVPDKLHAERNGYLETIGRVSGQPRETEIWFAAEGSTIYLLSGYHNRKDWIRNLTKTPHVRFRIAGHWFTGLAHEVTGDAAAIGHARHLLADKYYAGDLHAGDDWASSGTPYAIELDAGNATPPLDNAPRTGFIETIGRRSGQPHQTRIGFAVDGARLVMISSAGAGTDWVRNLRRNAHARFRIGDTWHTGVAHVATDDADAAAVRQAMTAKYTGSSVGTAWIETGLPIVFQIENRTVPPFSS